MLLFVNPNINYIVLHDTKGNKYKLGATIPYATQEEYNKDALVRLYRKAHMSRKKLRGLLMAVTAIPEKCKCGSRSVDAFLSAAHEQGTPYLDLWQMNRDFVLFMLDYQRYVYLYNTVYKGSIADMAAGRMKG